MRGVVTRLDTDRAVSRDLKLQPTSQGALAGVLAHSDRITAMRSVIVKIGDRLRGRAQALNGAFILGDLALQSVGDVVGVVF